MVMTGGKMPELNEKKETDTNQKITLSFLLNLFDGVLETPGRITFMTTNFVDKLDKAFTRPGRIDVIGKFGFADHTQLIAIIEHRYDTKLTDEQINIINNTHQCITPAEISRILFENFNDLDGALEGLVNYVDEYILNEKHKKEKEMDTKMKIALLENEVSNTNSPNVDTTNISQIPSDETSYRERIVKDMFKSFVPHIELPRMESEITAEQQSAKATNPIFPLFETSPDSYDADIKPQFEPWGQSEISNDQMSPYSPQKRYTKWCPI
jgi:hypothetical protein